MEDKSIERCIGEARTLQLLAKEAIFNKNQCANLIKKLFDTVNAIDYLMSSCHDFISRFGPLLKDLSRVVRKLRILVEENVKEDWLEAAINMDNEEAFKELLLELKISYVSACCLANADNKLSFNSATSQEIEDDLESFYKILQDFYNSNPERQEIARYLRYKLDCSLMAKRGGLDVSEYFWSLSSEMGADIGGGSFGMVSTANWMGKKYAIKTFSNEANFRNEAGILVRLNHPNIIKLLHFGTRKDGGGQDCYYIAMEIGQNNLGEILTGRKAQGTPLTYPVAIDIIFQIARGICYLHDKHVAHFDLKPSNILISKMHDEDLGTDGYVNVKIIDFFISESDVGNEAKKSTYPNRGTSRYMAPEVFGLNEAPEVFEPNRVFPFKADVYSFAMTCYEILTGEEPFEGEYRHRSIYKRISRGERPAFPVSDSYSRTLVDLIRRCWASNPAERPAFGKICATLEELKVELLTDKDASLISISNSPEIKNTRMDNDGCFVTMPIQCHCLQPFDAVCVPPNLVEDNFEKFTRGGGSMNASDLATFMRNVQGERDMTKEQAELLITDFHKVKSGRHLRIPGLSQSTHHSKHHSRRDVSSSREQPGTLDLPAFLKFLLTPELNGHRESPFRKDLKSQPTEDMTAPLSDYYIFSSHNSYLTGNWLTSKCSVQPIVDALRNGCRVIELDCWDGKDGKIKVLHGGTLTKAVAFEDCIKAIKANAFIASDYPVIITIESHLSQEHQKRAAVLLKEILGDMMFIPSADDRPPISFQSPEALKNRIIISDKPPDDSVAEQVAEEPEVVDNAIKKPIPRSDSSNIISSEDAHSRRERKIHRCQSQVAERMAQKVVSIRFGDDGNQDIPKVHEFEELLYIYCQKPSEMKERHLRGGPLLAGERAIMANLSESQLDHLIEKHPDSLIEFTKTNLGRMYPFGLRFDSSNADPMDAWKHGLQVAAVNMQGHDRPVWISKAFFSKNGGCGYVKKPDFLLPGSNMDHRNLQPKLELKLKVLLGTDWHRNYDVFKKPDYFVKVAVHGVEGDEVKQHTKVMKRSREPHWEDEEFVFRLQAPELAILRLEVRGHAKFLRDDFVGHSCVPVTYLRQGIRAVKLESRRGLPRSFKLLCHFSKHIIEPCGRGFSTSQ